MPPSVAAAQALVTNGTLGSATFDIDAYNFLNSQGCLGQQHDRSAGHPRLHRRSCRQWSTGSVTGLDNVDMWIGGLAEKRTCSAACSAPPSSTSSAPRWKPCRTRDRLYYLPRIEGMDYEESLQDSSLAQLIRANTGIKHLPGNIFLTPEYTVEAKDYYFKDPAR